MPVLRTCPGLAEPPTSAVTSVRVWSSSTKTAISDNCWGNSWANTTHAVTSDCTEPADPVHTRWVTRKGSFRSRGIRMLQQTQLIPGKAHVCPWYRAQLPCTQYHVPAQPTSSAAGNSTWEAAKRQCEHGNLKGPLGERFSSPVSLVCGG